MKKHLKLCLLVVLAVVLPLAAAHFTSLLSNDRIDVQADLLSSPSPASQFATQTDAKVSDPSLPGLATSHYGPSHAGEEDGNDNLFVSVGILALLTVLALASKRTQRIQQQRAQSDSGERKQE
jgi:hypothetical protein